MKRGFVYTTLFRQEDAMDKTYDVVALGELGRRMLWIKHMMLWHLENC